MLLPGGNMAKCVITFLFDGGQVFQESWELADGHRDPLPARLRACAKRGQTPWNFRGSDPFSHRL